MRRLGLHPETEAAVRREAHLDTGSTLDGEREGGGRRGAGEGRGEGSCLLVAVEGRLGEGEALE